jgi:hypothetical protein
MSLRPVPSEDPTRVTVRTYPTGNTTEYFETTMNVHHATWVAAQLLEQIALAQAAIERKARLG